MGCTGLKLHCVTLFVSSMFERHGRFVARHPLPFVIIPVVVSVLLAIGLVNINATDDSEYLYTPTNAPSKDERRVVQDTFPSDEANRYVSTRRSSVDGDLQVIFKAKGGGDIMTTAAFEEIIMVDAAIKNRLVAVSGVQVNYTDICGRWKGSCVDSDVLSWHNYDANNVGTVTITYPTYNQAFIGYSLGGVTTNSASEVTSAETVFISYYVRYTTDDDVTKGDTWIKDLIDYLVEYPNTVTLNSVTFTHRSFLSLDLEIAKSAETIVPFFAITYTILISFGVCVALMTDWVRAKPWAAFGGVMAACLAILSGLGLMAAAGVPFATTVATMPFLIIGKFNVSSTTYKF